MIQFDDKIVGAWFISTIPDRQDWLAAIREIEPDAKYELTYRFRYYEDDKFWDSKDKKNWYKGTLSGTRTYVVAIFRLVVKNLAERATGPSYEVMNDKGYPDFIKRFQDQPFVTGRWLSKEELNDYVDG